MDTVLALGSGLWWTVAYILIITRGLADQTYGMPLVALAANLSWEFVFVAVHPYDQPLWTVNAGWLLLDLVICYTALRFGPSEFPGVPRWAFYGMFALTAAIAFGMVLLVSRELDAGRSVYAAFGQNLLMSAAFLAMLAARRSTRGQSIPIAAAKLAGTGCASAAVYFYRPERAGSTLLPLLFLAILVLDTVYLVALAALVRVRPAPASGVVDGREPEPAR